MSHIVGQNFAIMLKATSDDGIKQHFYDDCQRRQSGLKTVGGRWSGFENEGVVSPKSSTDGDT